MKRLLLLSVLLAGCDLPSGSLPPTVATIDGPAEPQPSATYTFNLLVLGRDGAPVTQPTSVHLVLDSVTVALGLGLSTTPSSGLTDSLSLLTDARGVVPVSVTFGGRPGHAVIQTRAPSVGLDNTIEWQLPAGTASLIDVFPMVPPYLGDSATIQWVGYDAAAHPVFFDPVIEIVDPTIATLISPARLVATAYGFTWVRGTVGAARDSVPLAVVPHGRLGALNSGQWTEFDLNGSANTARFTAGGGFDGPRYSASGDSLVYSEAGHIMLRAGAAAPTAVVPGALGFASDRDPSWSADGQWIYFAGVYANNSSEIWRIHPNGTGASRIGPVASATDRDLQPSVNPAGTLLAMVTNRTLAAGQSTVRLINIGTGATVYPGPAGSSPRFEPVGGATVAFVSAGQVMLVNADGSNPHAVAPSLTTVSGQLDWMHTGRWIVVSATTPAGPYLHLVDMVGSLPIRLPYAFSRTLPAFR